jgi:polyhydroxybutyrate depolymerase
MPVMQIHGTIDGTVPYAGNILFQPIESVINYWVQINNCNTNAIFNAIPDVVTTDNCTAEHYVYPNGDNGVEVEFYKIIGGGHSWPGAPVNLNTTNMDFQANQEIWRFFRKYRLSGNIFTSIQKSALNTSNFKLFPNPSQQQFVIEFTSIESRIVSITNALGQLVKRENCTHQRIELDINEKGLYFITVQDKKGSTAQKLMIY